MIKQFQRTLGIIFYYQKTCIITPTFFNYKSKVSLNYIPSIHFANHKKEKYHSSVNLGILESNPNMTQNEISQSWQEDIMEEIEKSSTQGNMKLANDIFGMIQIYMDDWIINTESLISIDENILDYAENIIPKFSSEMKFSEVFWGLTIKRFQIQLKFLRYFDQMEDSEITQLYENYQILHQTQLDMIPNKFEWKKMECCIHAQTVSLYVSIKWNLKNEENKDFSRTFELQKYTIIQLLKIFEDLQTAEVENIYKAQRLIYVLERIKLLNNILVKYDKGEKFALETIEKYEKALEIFQNILSASEYKNYKIVCIFTYIQLGYPDKALNIALSNSEIRLDIDQTITFHYFLYYCLKKTENTTFNWEQLIQEPNKQNYDDNDQAHYNLLVSMQQLDNLIANQKYSQLQPIIAQLISKPQESDLGKYIIFPLLCELIIFNPKIPNRLNHLSNLLPLFSSLQFLNSSFYLDCQRNLYQQMIQLIIYQEKDDKIVSLFAVNIRILFNLSEQNQVLTIQREIINSIIKLIPLIESLKTYRMLAEIIDLFLFSLQKDKKKEQNKKWIEILNSYKMKLRQKYYKKKK